jgi:DnaJ-class molecular chaperone
MARKERRDLYEVLGVSRSADVDEIKSRYRALAREHHPDVNPEDAQAEARFKEVSEAWAVLGDEAKRRDYDAFGAASLEAGFDGDAARQARQGFGGGGFRFEGFGGAQGGAPAGVEDLLSGLFGGGRAGFRGPRPMRGADLEADLPLDFLTAARGGEQRLTLQTTDARGVPKAKTVSVRIPAGIGDGARIRLAGQGGSGSGGGPPGDLIARARVAAHPVFRRNGRDLLIELPLTVAEAIRGAKVEVPTLEGRATVTVPSGTDSGRRLRLRGKGLADPKGGPPGDFIATVAIRVPKEIDETLLDTLEALGEADGSAAREKLFD